MNGNQHFLAFPCMFSSHIGGCWSKHELFIYSLIQSCVSGSTRVKTVEPLGKSILDFDMVSFYFPLKPERQGWVMYSCLSGDIDLFDIVLGECLEHLSADVLFGLFNHHILCRQSTPTVIHIHTITLNNGTIDLTTRQAFMHTQDQKHFHEEQNYHLAWRQVHE